MGGGFLLRATVTGSNGVICALGDWNNGFALYLRNGQPSFCVNLFGDPYVVTGERTVDGPAEISVSYQRQSSGGGPMALSVNGVVWGTAELPADLPFRWQIGGGGLLVGRDRGFPVCDDYEPPFPFDGQITEVRLDALGLASPEVAELVRLALHRE
jgi:arylsulfatase